MMDLLTFLFTILLPVFSAHLVLASPGDRFDYKIRGNLIGVVILFSVIFLLLCLYIVTEYRNHAVSIKAFFRNRNVSLRPIAPSSVFSGPEANQDGAHAVELPEISFLESHRSRVSMQEFLTNSGPSSHERAPVRTRPSLIGLGIMTGRGCEAITSPAPARLPGGRISYGIGWSMPYESAWSRFGPPPTPPPTQPPPPLPASARRSGLLPPVEDDEDGQPRINGRFTASRSASAGL